MEEKIGDILEYYKRGKISKETATKFLLKLKVVTYKKDRMDRYELKWSEGSMQFLAERFSDAFEVDKDYLRKNNIIEQATLHNLTEGGYIKV